MIINKINYNYLFKINFKFHILNIDGDGVFLELNDEDNMVKRFNYRAHKRKKAMVARKVNKISRELHTLSRLIRKSW